jgi:hypothetical protein
MRACTVPGTRPSPSDATEDATNPLVRHGESKRHAGDSAPLADFGTNQFSGLHSDLLEGLIADGSF